MNIEIESRYNIKNRALQPFPARTALISVTDKDCDFVALKNKPDYLLKMRFDDVSDAIFEDLLGRKPTETEILQLTEDYYMFNDEQAAEIADFVKAIASRAELLICQCEYGQSRSAGIAAAVKQFLYGDGIEIFADERYFPNKLVYRKVLAALKNH